MAAVAEREAISYEAAAKRGAELLNKIAANETGATEGSKYDDYMVLERTGWDANDEDDESYTTSELPLKNIRTVTAAADLGDKYKKWIAAIKNEKVVAQYWEWFNVEKGTFIAFSNFLEKPVKDQISHFSDVTYLGWREMCRRADPPVHPGSLKHMLRFSIVNQNTVDIMDKALENAGQLPRKPWPGYELDMSTEGARAILGSSNGIGLAYMILDHQSEFGKHKRIQSVRIFSNDAKQPCLLFKLSDEDTEQK